LAPKPRDPAEDHSTLKQRAAAASIVASTILAVLKLAARAPFRRDIFHARC
jgi:hypothetical protein